MRHIHELTPEECNHIIHDLYHADKNDEGCLASFGKPYQAYDVKSHALVSALGPYLPPWASQHVGYTVAYAYPSNHVQEDCPATAHEGVATASSNTAILGEGGSYNRYR